MASLARVLDIGDWHSVCGPAHTLFLSGGMFEVLIESRGMRAPRPVAASALSVAMHIALVAGSVTGTHLLFDSRRTPEQEQALSEIVRYLVPPDRKAVPYAPRLQFARVSGGSTAAGIMKGTTRNTSDQGLVGTGAPGRNTADETLEAPPSTPAKSDEAFSSIEVDSAAVRDPESASPDYPRAMIEKGIEGYAAVRFVVDTTGRIDMATVQVIDATHSEFVKAVREVMPRMHFRPARIGTAVVRQLAEQLFKFEIKTLDAANPPPRKPNGAIP